MSFRYRLHPFFFRSLLATAGTWLAVIVFSLAFLALTNELFLLFSFDRSVRTDEDILWGPAFAPPPTAYKL